jgi:sec-independent protein translocase protein TatC
MPFLDHLEELRKRLLWSLAAVAVGALAGLWITMQFGVMEVLVRPVQPYLPNGRLIFTSPAEAFLATFKVGLFLGLLLALPVIAWQAWRFVAPGLLPHERRFAVPAMLIAVALFAAGVALSFLVVVPAGLRFFLTFQSAAFQPFLSVGAYLGFVMRLALVFGLVFETPLLVLVLTRLGIVPAAALARYRRHAIVVIAILSAALTPSPDALSMLLLFVPFYGLYEGSVQAALVLERRRARAEGVRIRRDPADAGPPVEDPPPLVTERP